MDGLRGREAQLKTVAEPYPFRIGVHDSLRDVMSSMLLHDMKELPVVDDRGNLAGTISYDNIHRHVLRIYSGNGE
jgi:Mg/Co/Ni transporter MgtE